MAEMRASPVKIPGLKTLADIVRMVEERGQMEILPFNPATLFPVSSTTLENLAYGNLPMAIPSQSNIPITKTGRKQEVAELAGLLMSAQPVGRGVAKGANYLGDVLTQAVTRNPQATSMRALDEISRMSPVPQITTYHGSPYLFSKFDPARVGTGEGAQAYGVGAGYTAEARPVAESYRASVAAQKRNLNQSNEQVTIGGEPIDWNSPEQVAAFELSRHAGDRKAAADFHARTFLGGEENPAVKLLRSEKELPKVDLPGYLYKGEIPDEIIPRFLNWDEPLTKDAPQEVKDSFNSILQKYPELKEPFFKAFRANKPGSHYYAILNDYAKTGDLYKNQLFASKVLGDAGIRGIRYLDQNSRTGGKNTSNFIPFSPEDYRIQEINDQPIADFVRSGRLQVAPDDPLAQFLSSSKPPKPNPTYGMEHRPMGEAGGASRLHEAYKSFGEDVYGKNALQYFGSGDPREAGVVRLMRSIRDNPDREVTIYRGVPEGVEGKINPGDWITLDKNVAEDYGKVVSMKVKAKDITTWPDSLLEFGYFPE